MTLSPLGAAAAGAVHVAGAVRVGPAGVGSGARPVAVGAAGVSAVEGAATAGVCGAGVAIGCGAAAVGFAAGAAPAGGPASSSTRILLPDTVLMRAGRVPVAVATQIVMMLYTVASAPCGV